MGSTSHAKAGLEKIEGNLNTLEAEKIARNSGLSFSEVVALAKSQGIGVSEAAKDNARAYSPLPAPIDFKPSPPPQYVAAPSSPSSSSSSSESSSSFSPPTTRPGEQVASIIDPQLAIQGASFQSNEAIALLRENAATERTKLEIANRIPEIQAKAQGEIDLQKIINAGYKNIKRLESTSNMFSSLMGAFNF